MFDRHLLQSERATTMQPSSAASSHTFPPRRSRWRQHGQGGNLAHKSCLRKRKVAKKTLRLTWKLHHVSRYEHSGQDVTVSYSNPFNFLVHIQSSWKTFTDSSRNLIITRQPQLVLQNHPVSENFPPRRFVSYRSSLLSEKAAATS